MPPILHPGWVACSTAVLSPQAWLGTLSLFILNLKVVEFLYITAPPCCLEEVLQAYAKLGEGRDHAQITALITAYNSAAWAEHVDGRAQPPCGGNSSRPPVLAISVFRSLPTAHDHRMLLSRHRCPLTGLNLILLFWAAALMCDHAPVLPAPLLTQEHSQGQGNVDLLCRAPPGYGGVMFQLYQDKVLVDTVSFSQKTPEALFSLEIHLAMDKHFCCLYQDQDKVYSQFSQYMKPAELLPAPSLSLTSQDPIDETEISLECVGSPSYPGALFSLFHLGSSHPVISQKASTTRHSARFSPPSGQNQYQCQYSVHLGPDVKKSERSAPITLYGITETNLNTAAVPPPAASDDGGKVDWPLIAGSLSASILFTAALGCLGFAVYKKVKALAEERRKREEALFWNHMHATDHVVDLTLRRISVGSQDWTPGADDRVGGTARSPSTPLSGSQYPFSTFRNLSLL
ncbi:uncharacterized protein LOC125742277 [Brienomyrus brachyistius]|uniref:uncharacterized protein LOC125742277 n=1 Tax=Brienomyrus brachyistius TaxID=42636 RepID=UPI0020B24CF9|nr:uncharacterized protein LOC125742277 [Brienomyrus brachyistius]